MTRLAVCLAGGGETFRGQLVELGRRDLVPGRAGNLPADAGVGDEATDDGRDIRHGAFVPATARWRFEEDQSFGFVPN